MKVGMMTRLHISIYGLLIELAALPLSAVKAEEYCVTCAAPSALYRCVIDGRPEGRGSAPQSQLLCIAELAKSGHHETCTVSKSAPYPCPGTVKVVAAPPELPANTPAEKAPDEQGDTSSAAAAKPAESDVSVTEEPAAAPEKVPETVEELADQTVETTKKGLKKAGEAVGGTAQKAGEQIGTAGSAIGNAAKKTWNCISSLFADC